MTLLRSFIPQALARALMSKPAATEVGLGKLARLHCTRRMALANHRLSTMTTAVPHPSFRIFASSSRRSDAKHWSAGNKMPHSGHSEHCVADLRAVGLSSRRKASRISTAIVPSGTDHPDLTPRQAEVLHWIAEGKTNSEIGTILGCSVETVKNHVKQVFQRLGVHSRTAAAAYAYRQILAEAERLRAEALMLASANSNGLAADR